MEQTVLINIDNNISRTNTEQLHYQKKIPIANFTQYSHSIDVRVTPVHSPIQVNCLLLLLFILLVHNFRGLQYK